MESATSQEVGGLVSKMKKKTTIATIVRRIKLYLYTVIIYAQNNVILQQLATKQTGNAGRKIEKKVLKST